MVRSTSKPSPNYLLYHPLAPHFLALYYAPDAQAPTLAAFLTK
jgi:hypothetical protein